MRCIQLGLMKIRLRLAHVLIIINQTVVPIIINFLCSKSYYRLEALVKGLIKGSLSSSWMNGPICGKTSLHAKLLV